MSQANPNARLSVVDRFLPVWIIAAMALGILLGKVFPDLGIALDKVKVAGVSPAHRDWTGVDDVSGAGQSEVWARCVHALQRQAVRHHDGAELGGRAVAHVHPGVDFPAG